MNPTVLQAPAGVNNVSAAPWPIPSGTTYNVVNGIITVSNPDDLPYVIGQGFTVANIATGSNPAANVAAINAALAQGGDYYISGTVPIDSSLLNGGLFGARLFGVGGWGATLRQNYGGTVLYWVGPAGLPMYVHQPNFGGGVFNLLFKGNTAAPPLCAILLDTGKYSIVTNSYSNPTENKNCTEGVFDNIWIGQSYSQVGDTDQTNTQFTNGIMFSGTVNGDTHKFGMTYISGVTGVGIYNKNPNAAGISFDTLLIKHSTNCIDTISSMAIKNLYCTSTDYNFLMRDTSALDIDTYYAENGGGIFKFLAGTITNYNLNQEQQLWIRNGFFQMLQTGNTTPYVGDVTTSVLWNIRLDDFNFGTPFASPQVPIINLISSVDNLRHGKHIIDVRSSNFQLSLGNNIIDGPVATLSAKYLHCAGNDNSVPAASPGFINADGFSANSSTSAALQLVNSDVYRGESRAHALQFTGAITAASIATLPSVASLLAAFPNAVVGQTFRLRFINKGGSGSGVWTISGTYGGSYLTLTGGGTPTWDTSTQKFGTAALLSGYGYSAAFPSWPGTAGTVQAWIMKSSVPSATGNVFCFDNGAAFSVALQILTSGFCDVTYLSGGTLYSFADTINVCDGVWHLAELDLNPSGIQFFLDGNLRITAVSHVPDSNQGPNFAIGVRARTFSSPWQGEIDEVSIWNTNLHTVSYTPPVAAWVGTENNLVELYHLDSDFTSAVTPTAGGGWTIVGGAAVGVAAYRDFIVTLTALGGTPTATLQAIDGL